MISLLELAVHGGDSSSLPLTYAYADGMICRKL